jgi:MFS family permease
MEQLLQPKAPGVLGEKGTVFWKNPSAWLQEKKLSRSFWIFFTAAFFFDFGFAIYYFLFNLYLLDRHFDERTMGLVGGALTLGGLVGTLPAGLLARKIGVRRLLIVCFIASPLFQVCRVLWMSMPAQIGFAFLAGLAMCTWGVSFLPAVARLTTEANRASAFSLIFSVAIGTSALGGVVCGYLPQWLSSAGFIMQAYEVKRLILVSSCAIAMFGVVAVLRLRIPAQTHEDTSAPIPAVSSNWFRNWKLDPFLVRFLPAMALWSAVSVSFTPFANVYLTRNLHIPMTHIGLIFTYMHLAQLCLGLLTPLVFRMLGLVNGIVATQIAASAALLALAGTTNAGLAVVLYMSFSAAQWMSTPGLYNLLMTETPDKERSTASAMTLFCNNLAGAIATAAAGILFTRFGYKPVLLGIGALTLIVAALFRLFVAPQNASASRPDVDVLMPL